LINFPTHPFNENSKTANLFSANINRLDPNTNMTSSMPEHSKETGEHCLEIIIE
jgi:hypothetical protein